MTMTARALVYVAKGVADLNDVAVVAPGPTDVLMRTLWSGISRGTERLVFEGRVPLGEYETMRAPFQVGGFPFPVRYGYSAVGRVEQGPNHLAGREVFCLHPHQDLFVVPASAVTLLPAALPTRRAVLAANMETALNALWDSGAGPGDRIAVVGAGVLGLLVAYLAAGLPGADVTVIDPVAARAPIVEGFGARFSQEPPDQMDADMVFHTSASAAGLACALACAGVEARIVEMSWFGDGTVAAPLGGAFHSRRLTLASSQVGRIAPSRRPRWDYARRLAKALELLCDARLDALITDEIAFAALPTALPGLFAPGAPGLTAVVRYG